MGGDRQAIEEFERQQAVEKWARDHVEAHREHDALRELKHSINESAMSYAAATVKFLLLINGGAAIAMLGFIGALLDKDKAPIGQVSDIAEGLVWFAAGVVAAALTSGFSYITNYCYAGRLSVTSRLYERPYLQNTPASLRWGQIGVGFHIASVTLAIVSLGLFGYGIWEVRNAVIALK
jgi:hypothetical protein